MITLEQARARVPTLPSDDAVATAIIAEEEAWLARRIGPLEGERTETFYVGTGGTSAKLALRRYTSSVVVTDGSAELDTGLVRLIDDGSAIERLDTSSGVPWSWVGPYVSVTYTPNDADEVRSALYKLLTIAVDPHANGPYLSEDLGDYGYDKGEVSSTNHAKAVVVASLLPKRDPLYVLAISRPIGSSDPVINRAELPL